MLRQFVFFICFAMLMLSNIDSSSGRVTPSVKRVVAQCFTDDELAETVSSLSREYDEAQVKSFMQN
jgi:hypothetical protein